MVILISLDTSAVGLLVYGYINITGYIWYTSAVGLLVYGNNIHLL